VTHRPRVPGTPGRRRLKTLFVVVDPEQPGLLPAERLALRLRRDATVSGVCACGAIRPLLRPGRVGGVVHAVVLHESDCPAADGPHLRRLAARLGPAIQYAFVEAEIEVAA
jgi:hypothetical protein